MSTLVGIYLSVLGKIPVIGLIILAATSVIIGDYAAKSWSENNQVLYLIVALVGYFLSGFFYIPTLLREGLIVTSVIWGILSTLGFIVIGILIFKESLTMTQTIAVALGIVSILLLTMLD